MSPEAFSAIMLGCKGKKSVTLFMPGIDPDVGLEIDPETIVPAYAHPDFAALSGTPDADALWLVMDEATEVGLGPIKIRTSGTSTIIDARLISAIDFEDVLDPDEIAGAASAFTST